MGRLSLAAISVAALLLSATPARSADRIGVGASLGQGMLVDPRPVGSLDATSLMISPGFQISPTLRTELGLTLALQPGGVLDIQLRPTLLVMPRAWPAYGRLTSGVVQLLTGPLALLLGGSVGTSIAAGTPQEQLSLFMEIGMLVHGAQASDGTPEQHFVIEARIGGYQSIF